MGKLYAAIDVDYANHGSARYRVRVVPKILARLFVHFLRGMNRQWPAIIHRPMPSFDFLPTVCNQAATWLPQRKCSHNGLQSSLKLLLTTQHPTNASDLKSRATHQLGLAMQ